MIPRLLPFPNSKTAALSMKPMPHQEALAKRLESEEGQVAYHGLGSGKTFSAIHAAEEQQAPLLAIVPAALRNNMRKEIAAAGFRRPFMVVSYQEALNRRDEPAFRDFAEKSVVAYDEAHRAGRAESARSALPSLLPAKKKLFLTGTPIRNTPEELAPLLNAIQPGTLPMDPQEFQRKYVNVRRVPVSFWGRLRGQKPEKVMEPKNLPEFENAVKGLVHHFPGLDRADYPTFSESVIEVPMSKRQQASYDFVLGKYPRLAYKIRQGLPMDKQETRDFQSFSIGPRQVSNSPAPFNVSAKPEDAAKIVAMANEVEKRWKTDPNYRGVSYSAFLDAGINPLAQELANRGIPHSVFTGEQDDVARKKIIQDYNSGKVPHLLISGAGAEGLDLKGTKLMQIAEPHWNEKLIDQVRGRAIRYKSHTHLPEKERHVEVQRFHALPNPTFVDRLLQRKPHGIDEYLRGVAEKKLQLSEPFLRILRGESAEDVMKTAEFLQPNHALIIERVEAWAGGEWVRFDPTMADEIRSLAEPDLAVG